MALKEEMVTIKFNSLCTPIMKWDKEANEFVATALNFDSRHEFAKLADELGDTEEETLVLKRLHSRMFNIRQAEEYVSKKQGKQFYYKDEIVSLSRSEAEYYLKQFCGGEVMLPDENTINSKKLVKGFHKINIDNKAGYYKASEINRFKREHSPIAVAEIYG